MAKADLHVHSTYSAHPSEWFLQRLGAQESYTRPETIYREAMKRGMTHVTITDHNEIAGALELRERYPHNVFTGTEATAYFPEDGCKVHILIYGLTEEQFRMIDKLRYDIYQLRDYIRQEHLAHAVAHATYAVNKKLTIAHLEKLFLLFDYFEGINGSRTRPANETLMDALASLTPQTVERLYRKYRIEPFSETAWRKGITGGTDDHSGLFIGKTYTEAAGETPGAFLDSLRAKSSVPCGRHNDYQGLAFAIYKIAYDFSQARSTALSSSFFNAVNQFIFSEKSLGLRDRLKIQKMKRAGGGEGALIHRRIAELVDIFQKNQGLPVERKMLLVYDKIAEIADCLFKLLISGFEQDMWNGDVAGLVNRIAGAIPGIFLSLPFFTTLNVLHESRALLGELSRRYGIVQSRPRKKILVMTDAPCAGATHAGMQAVASELPAEKEAEVRIAACCLSGDNAETAPEHILRLPGFHACTLSFLNGCTLRFPSVLSSLKIITDEDPDEIIVASPGPVGLLGLLASRLLHVRCTGLYQNIYGAEAQKIFGDDVCKTLSEGYLRWFYGLTDRIGVARDELYAFLDKHGHDAAKVVVFKNTQQEAEAQPLPHYALPDALPAYL